MANKVKRIPSDTLTFIDFLMHCELINSGAKVDKLYYESYPEETQYTLVKDVCQNFINLLPLSIRLKVITGKISIENLKNLIQKYLSNL